MTEIFEVAVTAAVRDAFPGAGVLAVWHKGGAGVCPGTGLVVESGYLVGGGQGSAIAASRRRAVL